MEIRVPEKLNMTDRRYAIAENESRWKKLGAGGTAVTNTQRREAVINQDAVQTRWWGGKRVLIRCPSHGPQIANVDCECSSEGWKGRNRLPHANQGESKQVNRPRRFDGRNVHDASNPD